MRPDHERIQLAWPHQREAALAQLAARSVGPGVGLLAVAAQGFLKLFDGHPRLELNKRRSHELRRVVIERYRLCEHLHSDLLVWCFERIGLNGWLDGIDCLKCGN